ncbi:MAG: type II toxin-antitoxin system RelE/ParE family toxin [Alphaproteobacteria bacterium]|nr:type II toxin-antitoxin system RelE/ParE family toxin [Alphaproteobacteria bacterium]
MYEIILEKRAIKFIKTLPPKHQRQLKDYILSFQQQPKPHDSQTLKGYKPYMRGDCGEYRIVYRVAEEKQVVYVILVGKRNGGEIYQRLNTKSPF